MACTGGTGRCSDRSVCGGWSRTTPICCRPARPRDGRLNDRVVQAALPWPNSTVRFPTVAELFVPPRYSISSNSDVALASDDHWWSGLAAYDDIVSCLAGHLLSPAATRAPLLLLGHPGAGKSMLTKVLAAHLPAAEYTTVNVPLRAVSAQASILDQIQQALDRLTHRRVQRAELADETADRLRVVLLDGLDELLQASDPDRTGYLHDVVRFQELEADQERPVAVIVTSRTVVADRVDIPEGTALLKLAEFDDDQIEQWLSRWNDATGGPATCRLTKATALRQPHLARQPLLLMLRALHAGTPGASGLGDDSSTAALYQELFTRFAARETAKTIEERSDTASIDRLSIAALAMFNRGQQHITEADLGRDLEALVEDSASRRPEETGQRLLAEFFFVHADEATLVGVRHAERSYEFLHATFGEYLVARKVLEVLRDIADAAFGGRRSRPDPEDGLLQALLGHQVLAVDLPIVQFAGEIFRALPEGEQSNVVAAVDFLIRNWRSRPLPDRYRTYSPTPFDHIRRSATYSANLVLLRLAFAAGNCLTREQLLPQSPAAEWASLVRLWRAGLDHHAWMATLGAVSYDRRRGAVVAAPPTHHRFTLEFDFARLIDDDITAERLGLGALHTSSSRGVFDPELDWVLSMQSWLVPAHARRIPDDIAITPPPDDVPEEEVLEVFRSMERLLKTRAADLSSPQALRIVALLLDVGPAPDPTALAVTICEHPGLLLAEPRLRDADRYAGALAAVLMMYIRRFKAESYERPPWDELYQDLLAASSVPPEDALRDPELTMLRRLWVEAVPRAGGPLSQTLPDENSGAADDRLG